MVATFGESLNSGGSLLSGFANTCEILSLLSGGGHYFRNFAVLKNLACILLPFGQRNPKVF